MRKHPLRRAGLVLLVALAALLPALPAHATELGTVTFTAAITFGQPFTDFPCADPVRKPCPPTVQVNVLPDPKGLPTAQVYSSGNITPFGWTNVACLDTKVAIAKPKTPVTAGMCMLNGGGTYKGHCGLGTGIGRLTYVASNGSIYNLTLRINVLGNTVTVMAGNVTTNLEGPAHITYGPGCENKTNSTAVLVGSLCFKNLNTP